MTQSLAQGWRRAWPGAFAPLLSDGPIILLSLLALSQLPAWLQRGLNLVSGLYLLYLAWGAFGQWRGFAGLQTQSAPAANRNLLKAALINLLNPAPYIYWGLVMGPLLVDAWRTNPLYGGALLLAFYAVLIGGLLGIMALFGAARQLGERVSRILLGLTVLALAGFGLFQIGRAVLA